jgi:signal peptidase II
MKIASRALTILMTAAAALTLDQTSKSAALAALQPHVPVDVTPFLTLRLGFNTGVSFGMFATDSNTLRIPLILLTAAIVIALIVMAVRANTVERVALSAIIGGAAGNLTDRVLRGKVTDFIDVHVAGWHWPAFNLADTAITLGVVTLLWASLRSDRKHQMESDR